MMAGPPPIEVKAIWDDTAWKTGTQDSERYLEELERAVNSSADEINRALKTADDGVTSTFGAGGAFDRSVSDVESSGSRLASVGGEVGAEMSENLGEAFRSGDYKSLIFESLTSLAPALGAAGIGIGIGAALIKNAIDGANDRREALVSAFDTVFSALEVNAKTTSREITKQLLAAFETPELIRQLGDGEALRGFERMKELIQESGESFSEIIDLMRRGINPETRDTAKALRAVRDQLSLAKGDWGGIAYETNRAKEEAEIVLGIATANEGALRLGAQAARWLKEEAQDIPDPLGRSADAAERSANGLERGAKAADDQANALPKAADAAERYAAALQRAADNFSRMYGRELPYGVYPG